jgi:ABC-type Mn2+/Zn2+ transport system permease subunit
VPALLAWSIGLALAEGMTGLYVAYWLDLPPGPPVAVLGAAVYAVLALGTAAR